MKFGMQMGEENFIHHLIPFLQNSTPSPNDTICKLMSRVSSRNQPKQREFTPKLALWKPVSCQIIKCSFKISWIRWGKFLVSLKLKICIPNFEYLFFFFHFFFTFFQKIPMIFIHMPLLFFRKPIVEPETELKFKLPLTNKLQILFVNKLC